MSVLQATSTEGRMEKSWPGGDSPQQQLRESREGSVEVASFELSPELPDRATAQPGAPEVQAEETAGTKALGQE